MAVKLYNYFRSSASYRVRIALHHKNIEFDYEPVHLLKEGGEQFKIEFQRLNPHSQVPCLRMDDKAVSQSMAIILMLEEKYPQPALFPKDPIQRAKVIEICEIINSGMQPFINLSTLNYLKNTLSLEEKKVSQWVIDFLDRGFQSLEKVLDQTAGTYCLGDELTAADVFLIPQVFSAQRYPFDIGKFPKVAKINEACEKLEAFVKAHPYRQPDCPEELKIL